MAIKRYTNVSSLRVKMLSKENEFSNTEQMKSKEKKLGCLSNDG